MRRLLLFVIALLLLAAGRGEAQQSSSSSVVDFINYSACAAASNNFITALSATGCTKAQPATTNLSDIGTFNLLTSGTVKTTNATASTTTGTGALIVTGGAGIGGAVNVGAASGFKDTVTFTESGAGQFIFNNAAAVPKAYIGTASIFGSAGADELRIRSETGNIDIGFSGSLTANFNSNGGLAVGTANTIVTPPVNGIYSGGSIAVRDTSAAFNDTITFTSSTALTAGRALTVDVVNGARTLKFGANLTIATDPGAVSGAVKSNGTGTFGQAATSDLSDIGSFNLSTSGTIATSNTTASTSGATGAITSGGGIGAAGALWAGSFLAVSGTTLPAQAAGTLGLGGEATTPTTSANGEADIWIASTTGGLTLQGKGSSTDIAFNNSSGSATCNISTGSAGMTCGFLTVNNSISPTNGIYLPAASTVGLVGATKIDLFSGASKVGDYNDTTASTWTLAAATTVNNATFKVTTLAASTAIDVVCYTTATGLFTEEPTGTTCTVSDERKKVGMQPISRKHSLDIILASRPISYYYKPELGDPDYHLGFGAQTLAKVAPELVQRDDQGVPNAVKQLELLPITWAAMQALAHTVEEQGREIGALKQQLGLRLSPH